MKNSRGLNYQKKIFSGLTYGALIFGVLVFCIPFIWMVLTSFKSVTEVYSTTPTFLPEAFNFINYEKILIDYEFWRYILNSLFIAICVTVGQVVFCSMAGYALARFKFRGRNLIFKSFMAIYMVPFVVLTLPLFLVIKELGWIDTYAALIIPKIFSVFAIFYMRQFFLSLPIELEEAAYLDGCSRTQTFFKVILPQMKPALATLCVLTFMGSWNDYLWPLIAAGDEVVTLPVALAQLNGQNTVDLALVMAGATISVLPILIIYLFAQKYIIQGFSNSGLK